MSTRSSGKKFLLRYRGTIPWPLLDRTIPGCLLPLRPLPHCVFPTLCVWTVKEIYLKTSQTKHHRLNVCMRVCVCVVAAVNMNSISFVWMSCLFRNGEEDLLCIYWHSRPGTRCRNIHNYIFFLFWDNEADCAIRRNMLSLPKNV